MATNFEKPFLNNDENVQKALIAAATTAGILDKVDSVKRRSMFFMHKGVQFEFKSRKIGVDFSVVLFKHPALLHSEFLFSQKKHWLTVKRETFFKLLPYQAFTHTNNLIYMDMNFMSTVYEQMCKLIDKCLETYEADRKDVSIEDKVDHLYKTAALLGLQCEIVIK